MEDKELLRQYQALVKFFLKKGLKVKEAVCFNKRVVYFRNDDFLRAIEEHNHEIPRILKTWAFENPLDNEKEYKKFISDLLENKIMLKLERGPDDPKYKWPKKLFPSKEQNTQAENAFYSFLVQPNSRSSRFLTILILLGVVALCLFQIWPLALKLGVFYVSVVLLYFLVGLIVIRLAVWILFRILGFNLYIFPNLFEDVAFLDSWRPFISFEKCEDAMTGYLARGVGLVFLAYMMFVLSQEPDMIHEYKDIGAQSFDDIMSWGRLKLEGKVEEAPRDDFRQRIQDLLNAADEDEALEKKPEDEKKDEEASNTETNIDDEGPKEIIVDGIKIDIGA